MSFSSLFQARSAGLPSCSGAAALFKLSTYKSISSSMRSTSLKMPVAASPMRVASI